jgi:tight adherence protein C
MDSTTLLIICIAGAVAAIVFVIFTVVFGKKDEKIISRLTEKQPVDSRAETVVKDSAKPGIAPILPRIGQAAAEPFMPKNRDTQSAIRKKMGTAGIYNPTAIKVMTGAKVILLVVGLGLGYALAKSTDLTDITMMSLCISAGGLLGYLLPMIWLKLKIKSNQLSLTYGLPDALDLMVVCVESGLTVDAAIQRVGSELGLAHPALSRELAIAHMETRVGLSRGEALKNLGERTGVEGLKSLSSMLTQADRFGTSIANALRVQAETLRSQRQAAAEEMAAKASVKMSFPLVLFIFPATFIVLAGPTVIGLLNSPLFK